MATNTTTQKLTFKELQKIKRDNEKNNALSKIKLENNATELEDINSVLEKIHLDSETTIRKEENRYRKQSIIEQQKFNLDKLNFKLQKEIKKNLVDMNKALKYQLQNMNNNEGYEDNNQSNRDYQDDKKKSKFEKSKISKNDPASRRAEAQRLRNERRNNRTGFGRFKNKVGKFSSGKGGLITSALGMSGMIPDNVIDMIEIGSSVNDFIPNKMPKISPNIAGKGILQGASKLAPPLLAAYGIYEGSSMINEEMDVQKQKRLAEQQKKGLRDPENISELWDRILGDESTTKIIPEKLEKIDEGLDKFAKSGIKNLNKTDKGFEKSSKSLNKSEKELKETTEDLKEINDKGIFESILDTAQGVLNKGKEMLGIGDAPTGTNNAQTSQATASSVSSSASSDNSQSTNSENAGAKATVNNNQKDMMIGVFKAFQQAGFSEAQAKALTAEVGRENAYNAKYVFGTHTDAANSATNTGFFSWQGSRSTKLQKRLKDKGLMKDGKMVQSQEALNEMANFAKEEMNSGQYKGLGDFMSDKDIDSEKAAKLLGKGYIKWAYGQDRLKSGKSFDWRAHDKKRAGFYNKISELTKTEGIKSDGQTIQQSNNIDTKSIKQNVNQTVSGSIQSVNEALINSTNDAIAKNIKYKYGSKDINSGAIDCSGWIMNINQQMSSQLSDPKAIQPTLDAMKKGAGEQGAAGIIQAVGQVTGKELSGSDVNLQNLKEGMVMGIDYSQGGAKSGEGRYKGIDHIVQVVRNKETGELEISESSSKKGVHTTSAAKWLERNKNKAKFAVDPYAALRGADSNIQLAQKPKEDNVQSLEPTNVATQAQQENVSIPNASVIMPNSGVSSVSNSINDYFSGLSFNNPMPVQVVNVDKLQSDYQATSDKLEQYSKNNNSAPVIINNNTNNNQVSNVSNNTTTQQGFPLITRNPDSSIAMLNRNLMFKSMS